MKRARTDPGPTAQAAPVVVPTLGDPHGVVIHADRSAPSCSFAGTTCHLSTQGLTTQAAHQVWNYAFLVNLYISLQRGRTVMIKATAGRARESANSFASDIRRENPDLFPPGETGRLSTRMGHVPDTALIVGKDGYPTSRKARPYSLNGRPTWMPMARSANSRVAEMSGKTGERLSKIIVDGVEPDVISLKGVHGNCKDEVEKAWDSLKRKREDDDEGGGDGLAT